MKLSKKQITEIVDLSFISKVSGTEYWGEKEFHLASFNDVDEKKAINLLKRHEQIKDRLIYLWVDALNPEVVELRSDSYEEWTNNHMSFSVYDSLDTLDNIYLIDRPDWFEDWYEGYLEQKELIRNLSEETV